MHINGSIPVHVARAYGVNRAQPTRPAGPATPAQPVARIRPSDSHEPGQTSNAKIDALVAGRVDQPISFQGAAAPKSAPNAVLQLYTRAADRIEAATAVQLGRSLDVTG